MKPKVAVVDADSFGEAVDLIGGLSDLNNQDRDVIVKVGIYNVTTGICSTVKTVNSIVESFDEVPAIRIAESDSGAGPGLERLKLWNECFNSRVTPFNLSDDETREVRVAGETVPFSSTLLGPKTFISTHVPRRYEEAGLEDLMNLGSIIKNLLGLVLDTKKHRFHEELPNALLDMYEASGGIDLAVLDGTKVYLGKKKERAIASPNVLVVGRDAFAVEAVGMHLVGFDPLENPVLLEARRRGLGEIDVENVDIIGDIETPRSLVLEAFKDLSS
ncbi:MAG: DUF362 domain-containing protein [Candidatus Thorarchaeota archaeon]|nr:MAG: DUF362 domain-containing protein [Candidatus Thorarchaeota archaeon]